MNKKLLTIAMSVAMTGAPLAVHASTEFLGYKCGEGSSPIAFQHNQCLAGVIEHKVMLIGNLVKLIDSTEIGTEATVSLQKSTAGNMAIRQAANKEAELINLQKEQAYKQRQAEMMAANAQVQAQANRDYLLNNINKKLSNIRTQQIVDNNNLLFYRIQHH